MSTKHSDHEAKGDSAQTAANPEVDAVESGGGAEEVDEVVPEAIFDDEVPDAALVDDPALEWQQQVDALTKERDELRDQMLRARADFDNYRKRMMREQDTARTQAAKALLTDLLPVLDHLEMAVAHGDDESGGLREGVQMTAKQLTDVLSKHGCVPIEAAGAVFDPELHEAMMQSSSDEAPEGHVVQEFQRGYRLGDIVLRHARVIVSTGPETADSPDE